MKAALSTTLTFASLLFPFAFFEVHHRGHLGELPHLRPVDAPLFAARDLVEEDAPELLALAAQHELLGEGPGRVDEAEAGVCDDAYAFQGHQRAYDVGEVRGQAERVLVHHLREVVGQLLEVHVAELQVQVVAEEPLDDGAHAPRVYAGLEEVQVYQVLREPFGVAADDVEEGVYHLRLQARRDAADHAEVEEREVARVHHEQVAGVRVCVEEAVFQKLLQVRAHEQAVDLDGRDAPRLQAFQIRHLRAAYELHR